MTYRDGSIYRGRVWELPLPGRRLTSASGITPVVAATLRDERVVEVDRPAGPHVPGGPLGRRRRPGRPRRGRGARGARALTEGLVRPASTVTARCTNSSARPGAPRRPPWLVLQPRCRTREEAARRAPPRALPPRAPPRRQRRQRLVEPPERDPQVLRALGADHPGAPQPSASSRTPRRAGPPARSPPSGRAPAPPAPRRGPIARGGAVWHLAIPCIACRRGALLKQSGGIACSGVDIA